MEIGKIDGRLSCSFISETDVLWQSVLEEPFSIFGVKYDGDTQAFLRIPREISVLISEKVSALSERTAGGRVRFRTNSPYVAIRCTAPAFEPMPHMPITGSHGFSVYCDGVFAGKVSPSFNDFVGNDNKKITFGGVVRRKNAGWVDVDVYMPLYGGVSELYIGIKEGAQIEPPREYKYKKPIVIYGSSITQGACASRPGNDFAMRLSRMLDADVLNLGFSGNGNAEPKMLEYLASIDALAYVFDYNYYAECTDRVLPPHYEIYRALRDSDPNVPILMIDKPSVIFAGENYKIRSQMIRDTYERAISEGDGRVAMMDATELFGEEDADSCVVDTDHPNDLGFFRMANAIYPYLKGMLDA